MIQEKIPRLKMRVCNGNAKDDIKVFGQIKRIGSDAIFAVLAELIKIKMLIEDLRMILLLVVILANVGAPIDMPKTPKGPNGPKNPSEELC